MSNRVSTAPHKPVAPVSPHTATAGTFTPSSHRWGVRRRAMVASLVVLALVTSIAGVYAWRIVSALNDSQGNAVVPLPTRSSSIAFVGTSTPTPGTTPASTRVPTPTPRPTNITAADSTPRVGPSATPVATPVAAPMVGSSATPATTPVATPEANPSPLPAVSPVTSEATDVALTSAELTPLATSDDLSRLDIAQIIVSASMGSGDPGRSSVWQGKTAINILVLGVDRRPDGGDQNSDVIIIARVDLVAQKVSAVSVPRDLFVDVPDIGYTGKINGAYNAGVGDSPDDRVAGVVKIRDTIENLYLIPIDSYVLIDFNGFEKVIDAVGGVDVNVPAAIVDEAYPTIDYGTERVEFKAGPQHMDGDRALKYVRTRNTDSDDARRQRQIDVLLALFDQGKSFDSIRHGDEVIVALSDTVQTGFDLYQQLTLARIARQMDRSDITLTTLAPPLISGGFNADGAWVYSSDPVAVAAFIQENLDQGTA